MSDKVFLGMDVAGFEAGEPQRVTRVNVVVDSDHYYTAGDDTGRTMEVYNPWATQAMANSILAVVSKRMYKPYTGSDALLDPAAEIGDAVTVAGEYSDLAEIDWQLDEMFAANISAPAEDEIIEEYPYKTREQRIAERNLAITRSLIKKTSEEIGLVVESVDDLGKKVSTSLTVDANGVIINHSGSKVVIDGKSIKAHTVTATEINADQLKVKAANVTGTLTIGQIPSDVATKSGVTTIVRDTVTTSYINALDITARYVSADGITGGEINGDRITVDGALYARYNGSYNVGYFGAVRGSFGDIGVGLTTNGGEVVATSGGTRMSYGRNQIYISDQCQINAGQWLSITQSQCNVSRQWSVGSDRRLKNHIDYEIIKADDFFRQLKPCMFRMNAEDDGKTHFGFIAQDVEAALKSLDKDSCIVSEYEGMKRVAYGEFIALNTHMIQQLMKKVERLEAKMNEK